MVKPSMAEQLITGVSITLMVIVFELAVCPAEQPKEEVITQETNPNNIIPSNKEDIDDDGGKLSPEEAREVSQRPVEKIYLLRQKSFVQMFLML